MTTCTELIGSTVMELHPEAAVNELYFCDGLKDTPLLERRHISADKRETLRSLQHLNPLYNLTVVVFVFLWFSSGYLTGLSQLVATRVLGILVMGFALNGLTILMRESCHSLLSKNPAWNRWLGFFCGIPGLVSVSAYKSVHIAHHAFVKSQADPDNIENNLPKIVHPYAGYFLVLFMGIYFYLPSVAVIGFRKGNRDVRKKIVAEYLILGGVYAALVLMIPADLLLLYWLLPLLVAAQLSNVRGLAEHGFTAGGNEFTATRTIKSNRFVSFFMCNLNYHLEHHLFPGIPWYHLPVVHRLLKEEFQASGASVYRSYTEFLIDFFRVIWTEGVKPDGRLLPAHIREELCL